MDRAARKHSPGRTVKIGKPGEDRRNRRHGADILDRTSETILSGQVTLDQDREDMVA
jgi:hypothetical protein